MGFVEIESFICKDSFIGIVYGEALASVIALVIDSNTVIADRTNLPNKSQFTDDAT